MLWCLIPNSNFMDSQYIKAQGQGLVALLANCNKQHDTKTDQQHENRTQHHVPLVVLVNEASGC